MNEFLRRAKELEHQMQKDRRYLHQHAEAGNTCPEPLNMSWNAFLP